MNECEQCDGSGFVPDGLGFVEACGPCEGMTDCPECGGPMYHEEETCGGCPQ